MLRLLWKVQTNLRPSSAMITIPPAQYHSIRSSSSLPSVCHWASSTNRRTSALTCSSSRRSTTSINYHEEFKRRYLLAKANEGAGVVLDGGVGGGVGGGAGGGAPIGKPKAVKSSPARKRTRSTTTKSPNDEGNSFAKSVTPVGKSSKRMSSTAAASNVRCGPEVMYDLRQVGGVGEKTAQVIFEAFGGETANTLNLNSIRAVRELQTVSGIGPVKAKKIKEDWDAGEATRALTSDLIHKCKLDFFTAKQLVANMERKELDLNAELDKDPYIPLLYANPQISFESVDGFAMRRLGEEQAKAHPSRVCAAVIHELKLADVEYQHSCLPWGKLKHSTAKLLGYALEDKESEQWMVDSIVRFMSRKDLEYWDLMICIDTRLSKGRLRDVKNWGKGMLCFLQARWDSETAICDAVVSLLTTPTRRHWKGAAAVGDLERVLHKKFPGEFDFQGLSDGQKKALEVALSNNIVVITGWPGSGKTFCMRFIIACILNQKGAMDWGYDAVGVCAPTGRAASNLKGKLGLPVDPKTIHRLLERQFGWQKNDEEGWEGRELFVHNRRFQLRHNFLGVDETSMIDASLFSSLLEAVSRGTGVCLVGDPNQLPSVGAGQVLQDLIDSGIVPVVELRQIYRQAENSAIAANAHAFLKDQMPSFQKVTLKNFKDFPKKLRSDCVWLEVPDGVNAELEVQSAMMDVIEEIRSPRDIQVVSCTKKGDPGTIRLNALLQDLLNRRHLKKPEGKFEMLDHGLITVRVRDKVIQCKNDYSRNVFNGDLGEVVAVNANDVDVLYPGRNAVRYSRRELSQVLQPAWALTVHRSQGAEFPIVVMPVVPGKANNTKKMFYTAMTRASRHLVIIGTKDGLHECLTTETKARFSGIKAKLERLRKERKLPKVQPQVFG
ncbi:hypothetical protein BSKO_05056 [Bryopsis sp. KO-2023]|nr:hypothetical protein BSKO_05056 [Bryopsis sp. KO-2023]